MQKLIIKAVVINPKKAPDTSSIIPIGVISRIYFTALVILFIMKLDKKKVRIIDPKLRRSSSVFGKIINKKLDVMWEQLSDIIILKKIDKNPIRLILLDEVTDPQNVGVIIRSALAFKMDGLALSQKNSPQETSALIKASSGALEKLKIIELSNMSREIKKLQHVNFSVFGLATESKKTVYELENETGNVALILGSEGKGLRRLTKENVDGLIKIPINIESDSLNVSNAASVAMFLLQRNIIKN